MNRRGTAAAVAPECRSDGCHEDVVFKTVEGFGDAADRRPGAGRGDRASPNGYHRHSMSSTRVMSAFCERHTCSHFFRPEGCANKKPQFDSVCAIHARCPAQECTQARGQYLDTSHGYVPGTVPRYARYELCFDHKCIVRQCQRGRATPMTTYCQMHGCQAERCTNPSQEQRNCCEEHMCRADGCRTIVEGDFPYCVIHIKCEVHGCNHARHHVPRSTKYLASCTEHVTCEADRCQAIKIDGSRYCMNHTCRERDCDKSCQLKPYCSGHACALPKCEYPRPRPVKQKKPGEFCPLHTCREKDCQNSVTPLSLYCKDHNCSEENCLHEVVAERFCIYHLKDHYMTMGTQQAMALRGGPRYTSRNRRRLNDNATDTDTATDTESDNERIGGSRPGPTQPRKPHSPPFNNGGSNVSNNSNSTRRDDAQGPRRAGTWQGQGQAQKGGSSFSGNTAATASTGNNSNVKRPREQQQHQSRHWEEEDDDDDGPSHRNSMGSANSLAAENGDGFISFGNGGPPHPSNEHIGGGGVKRPGVVPIGNDPGLVGAIRIS